ncbi:hypothetical protein CRYUN_Cryun08bG0015900 [Craigia yunnanensis]
MRNKDQSFLLYFIFGTYFGPDLKGEKSHKSVLQRKAEGLSSYTSDELAGSHIETVQLERIYYYVLRKANKSLVVNSPLLDQFFKGNLPTPHGDEAAAIYPQFPDLFPLELHPHSRLKNGYNIIGNIVFIHNPEISYMRIEDIARFARLSRLEDFFLDREAARLNGSVDSGDLYNVIVREAKSMGDLSNIGYSLGSQKTRVRDKVYKYQHLCMAPPIKSTSSTDAAMSYKDPVLTKDETVKWW